MAAILVLAVAAQRKVGLSRKRGQEVQDPAGFRLAHFRTELPLPAEEMGAEMSATAEHQEQ